MRTKRQTSLRGGVRFLALLVVTAAAISGSVQAQTNNWTYSSGGYWDDFRNWSLSVRPASTQAVFIANATNKLVTVDSYTSSNFPASMTVTSLTLSAGSGTTNTLFLSNAGTTTPLTVQDSLAVLSGGYLYMTNSSLQVGGPAGGSFVLEGTAVISGTNLFAGGVYLGYSTNSSGPLFVLDGRSVFTNGYTAIGFYGSGDLELPKGILQVGDSNSAPNGVFVGLTPGGQGTVHVAGGTLLVPDHLSIGDQSNSVGAVWVTGGQLMLTDNYLATVGGDGTGQLVISNAQVAACSMVVGTGSNSVGTLTVAGGTATLSGGLVVGDGLGATGFVSITGSQLTVTNQNTVVGSYGFGQMTVSNSTLLAQGMNIGNSTGSVGALVMAGSTTSVSSNLIAGVLSNATGVIQLTSGSLTVTNQSGTGQLVIGQLGRGTFTQNGGVLTVDQFTIGSMGTSNVLAVITNIYVFAGGAGQAVISNGLIKAQALNVGVGSNTLGSLTIAGGTISVASSLTAGVLPNASGGIQVTGGSLTVTNLSGTGQLVIGQAGRGTFTQSGGVATVDQLLVANGTNSTFTFNGGVFNTKSTTVSNSQQVVVGNGATYHLLGGVHSFANGLLVASGGTLSGCGTIIGNVSVNTGGTVLTDCGTLTFMNGFSNVGHMRAVNGSVLEAYGPVINVNLIDVIDGQTNFHAGVVNNGVILTRDNIPHILAISLVGSNAQITFTTFSNQFHIVEFTDDLLNPNWLPVTSFINGPAGITNIIDSGAATLTQRFYRVHLEVSVGL